MPANLTELSGISFQERWIPNLIGKSWMEVSNSISTGSHGLTTAGGERRSFPFDYVYNPIRRVFEDNRKYSEYIDAKFSKNAPTKRQQRQDKTLFQYVPLPQATLD